jgi:hypothetical protein
MRAEIEVLADSESEVRVGIAIESRPTRHPLANPEPPVPKCQQASSRSAAVVSLLAKLLEPQNGVIEAAFRLLSDSGIDDLADHDRVIAALDRIDQLAFDKGGGLPEKP